MQQKNCVSRTFAHKSAKFAYSLANHYPIWVKIDPLREAFNVILSIDWLFSYPPVSAGVRFFRCAAEQNMRNQAAPQQ
ncbi:MULTISPECIES: hypothetical protein [Gibbsiella]|uniref:hypothetical protein n=1 Tax=Gibbsiella TaxID=929812 RepID=UPI00242F7FD3|nr:hypothetical protein [Gibbsiella quercinecans]